MQSGKDCQSILLKGLSLACIREALSRFLYALGCFAEQIYKYKIKGSAVSEETGQLPFSVFLYICGFYSNDSALPKNACARRTVSIASFAYQSACIISA